MKLHTNYYGKYSTPKLVDWKGDLSKRWFLKYLWIPKNGKKKYIQVRGSINSFDTISERRERAEVAKAALIKMLVNDHDPITHESYFKNLSPQEQWQQKPINEALKEMLQLNHGKYASGTIVQYGYAIEYFNHALKSLQSKTILKKPLTILDLKPSVVKLIMDEYGHTASNYAYNKNYTFVSAVGRDISKAADLSYNAFSGVDQKPVAESQGFIMPTDKEQKLIKEHLSLVHPKYLDCLMFTYHAGIRLKETLKIKPSDINIGEMEIKIVPDLARENSKTKLVRNITINRHLMAIIKRLDLTNKNYYLFGKVKKTRGWEYFVPSPVPFSRSYITYLWKKLVKDPETGLGLDCDAYGLKHKGTSDRFEAGVSFDANQGMLGHGSKRTTRIYMRATLQKAAKKEIIEKSPEF